MECFGLPFLLFPPPILTCPLYPLGDSGVKREVKEGAKSEACRSPPSLPPPPHHNTKPTQTTTAAVIQLSLASASSLSFWRFLWGNKKADKKTLLLQWRRRNKTAFLEGLAHTWHCAGNRSSGGGGGGDKLIPLRLFETRDLCRYPKETFCPLSTPTTPTTPTSLLQFFPSLLLSPKKGGWAIREAGLYRVRTQGNGVRRGEEEEGGGGGGLCSLLRIPLS